MKALVLEIKNGVAAVLKEDGTVERVRRSCKVGETIELPSAKGRGGRSSRVLRYAAAALLALVLLGGGGGYYLTASACSYVSLDVNPSLEFALNRMDRVISVRALNDDAGSVADALNASGVRGKTLANVLDRTMDILYDLNYLDGGGDDCVLAAVAADSPERTETLSGQVSSALASSREDAPELCVVTATLSERKEADRQGISTGRYETIRDIKDGASSESGDDSDGAVSESDVEEYGDAPVRELLQDAGKLPADAQTSGSGDTQTSGQSGSGGQSAAAPAAGSGSSSGTGSSSAPAQDSGSAQSSGSAARNSDAAQDPAGQSGSAGAGSGTQTQPTTTPSGGTTVVPSPSASAADPAAGQSGSGQTAPGAVPAAPDAQPAP